MIGIHYGFLRRYYVGASYGVQDTAVDSAYLSPVSLLVASRSYWWLPTTVRGGYLLEEESFGRKRYRVVETSQVLNVRVVG